MAFAQARVGRLEVDVSTVGIGPVSPREDLTVAEWEDLVEVNVQGLPWGSAAALPVVRAQGRGHLIAATSSRSRRRQGS